jgi:hypothetical protein
VPQDPLTCLRGREFPAVVTLEGESFDSIVHMRRVLLARIEQGELREHVLRVTDFEVCSIGLWDIHLTKHKCP